MPTWLIIVLIVLACGMAVGGFFLYRSLKRKREYEALTPAQRELHDAEAEYAAVVKQAEKEHAGTIKALDKEVAAAEKDLQRAINGVNKQLGKYGQVRLYEDRLVAPEGTAYFEQGEVEAVVDTAGNIAVSQRITLTRLVAGGVIGGIIFPKKKVTDSRELYLMVRTPGFASMVECKPEHGALVRKFANTINNSCRSAPQAKESRKQAIASAKTALESAKQRNDQGSANASTTLDAIRQDTGRIDGARDRMGVTPPILTQPGDQAGWK